MVTIGLAIAKAVENNHTISTLKLCDNFLTEGILLHISKVVYVLTNIAGAGQAMADLLIHNGSLTVIDLTGNQVNHTTTKFIKKICKKNRTSKKVFNTRYR